MPENAVCNTIMDGGEWGSDSLVNVFLVPWHRCIYMHINPNIPNLTHSHLGLISKYYAIGKLYKVNVVVNVT